MAEKQLYIHVLGFTAWQHYSDRCPPWLKDQRRSYERASSLAGVSLAARWVAKALPAAVADSYDPTSGFVPGVPLFVEQLEHRWSIPPGSLLPALAELRGIGYVELNGVERVASAPASTVASAPASALASTFARPETETEAEPTPELHGGGEAERILGAKENHVSVPPDPQRAPETTETDPPETHGRNRESFELSEPDGKKPRPATRGLPEVKKLPREGARILYPQEFELVWQEHPRGNKRPAYSAFRRLTRAERSAVFAALPKHVLSWADRNAQYTPHLSTWLNARAWEADGAPGRLGGDYVYELYPFPVPKDHPTRASFERLQRELEAERARLKKGENDDAGQKDV